MLLSTAAAMVDGVYQDIAEALKPGIRENEIVALANKRLYEMGSDDVEAINAVSGERCNPHPHNFSDRLIRPRRPGVLRHHPVVQRLPDLLLPHVRGGPLDAVAARRLRPGAGVDRRGHRAGAARYHRPDRAGCGRGPRTSGSRTRWPRSVCSSATGWGSGLHERPIISRLNSLEHPVELHEGMVFALETYCPASDGYSAARIEEEVVVTADGAALSSRCSRPRNSSSPTSTDRRDQASTTYWIRAEAAVRHNGRPSDRPRWPCTASWSGCARSRSAPTTCSCRTW